MADIQDKIMRKYSIDITQENILKLYKIDTSDITKQGLEEKFVQARKRWNIGANGINEKNAERDKQRLQKADTYEAILLNEKLFKELYKFYNKQESGASNNTVFAKEYFELVATTKKINKADVEFYFKYFKSERKNRKEIQEMLTKELKVLGLGKNEEFKDEESETKNKPSGLIVNLFQEETILKIRRGFELYEEALQSKIVCDKFPLLRDGLYEFLDIKKIKNANELSELMKAQGDAAYVIRQEYGTEYRPLVDLFNLMQSICEYSDIKDNMPEFKLLLKYPTLTPFMFSFVDIKKSTMKGLQQIASRDYAFRDTTDFILTYYKVVSDNFGLSNGGIKDLIKKAEKLAKQNQLRNAIDEKIGKNKKKKKRNIGINIIHWLTYWPIFMVYLVFEIIKVVFTKLNIVSIPVAIIWFLLQNWLISNAGMNNIVGIAKIFFKGGGPAYIEDMVSYQCTNGITFFIMLLVVLICLFIIYGLPALCVYLFLDRFTMDFNKKFDWCGIERTFKKIFSKLKDKTEQQVAANKKNFIKKRIPKIICNIMCLLFVIIGVIYLGKGWNLLGKPIESQFVIQSEVEDASENSDSLDSNIHIMVITETESNIRTGPSVDYSVIMVASEGQEFRATGNQETAGNGSIWYEIYLNEGLSETGWASEKVIAKK